MKVVVALFAAAVAAHAQHAHRHMHRRQDGGSPVDVVNVPGPTVVVYELNGRLIPEDEVQQGLANGTLVMAPGGQLSSVAQPAPSTEAPAPAPTTSEAPPPPPPSSSSEAPPPAPSVDTQSNVQDTHGSGGSGGSGWDDSSNGVDDEFPDGQLDCSTFPSDYGAIPVNYLGLGGWTGIQQPNSFSGGLGNIKTLLTGEGDCQEGCYCSYACSAGYQKSQWPTEQGATGQSVGGLLCQNGKLHLTNPGMSTKLCMTGATQVNIQVENRMSQNVPVCRTDYPGTESETVPLNVSPGQTSKLTCPDADNYYNWQGSATSAQYYVNPAGTSVEDGCQWGSDSNPTGNYAPMNLGVGYSNGAAWLSIFQNYPTTMQYLNFKVTVEGDSQVGSCTYSNGQYCSQNGCNNGNPTSGGGNGCTVSASSGTVTFIFEDA